MNKIQVCASILSADPAKLGEEIQAVTAAGADLIHIDIMDGHFVPNITFGPTIIESLKAYTHLPFDVHLMVEGCDPFIEMYAKAADRITIHSESSHHVYKSLMRVKELGKLAGIALNPGTPLVVIDPLMEIIDLVLVMSVNPGFGGQNFIPSSLARIRAIKTKVSHFNIKIAQPVKTVKVGDILNVVLLPKISFGHTILCKDMVSFQQKMSTPIIPWPGICGDNF